MLVFLVAGFLLDNGLEGLDACIFLDDDDNKMVMTRISKRPMLLDRCGIKKEKLFAFYDQFHTTGTDLKLATDAVAAITLGKDMTLRDYSQACYRMRGLGKGQKLHLFLVAEVLKLVRFALTMPTKRDRSVKKRRRSTMKNAWSATKAFRPPIAVPIHPLLQTPGRVDAALYVCKREDAYKELLHAVVAWLLINTMRSEHLQLMALTRQSVHNVWRRDVFHKLMTSTASKCNASPDTRGLHTEIAFKHMNVFKIQNAFDIDREVSKMDSLSTLLSKDIEKNAGWISVDLKQEANDELAQVKTSNSSATEFRSGNSSLDSEMVQEQHREQQMQNETEIQQKVTVAYDQDLVPVVPWAMGNLVSGSILRSKEMFYPLCDFTIGMKKTLNELSGQLCYNDSMLVSKNYAPHTHCLKKNRRLKNVHVLLRACTSETEYCVILALSEAQTLRRYLDMNYKSSGLDISIISVDGLVLTNQSRSALVSSHFEHMRQCARFFNNSMWFKGEAVVRVLRSLSKSPASHRRRVFEDVLACRRRQQIDWKGTDVATILSHTNEYSLKRTVELLERVRGTLKEQNLTVVQAFSSYDSNNDGVIDKNEFDSFVKTLDVNLSSEEIGEFARHVFQNTESIDARTLPVFCSSPALTHALYMHMYLCTYREKVHTKRLY